MAWTSLSNRLAYLPLIIAGPILRKVGPESVTVWLALKSFREVKLQIKSDNGYILFESDNKNPIKIGTNLFITTITAEAPSSVILSPGNIYQYEIIFTDEFNNIQNLNSDGVLHSPGSGSSVFDKISYGSFDLPTFCLPAQNINDLRFLQCSCRKPHGEGLDALAAVDIMLASDANNAITRPQMLIMGGDQIYADDVADTLLRLVIDGNTALIGWDEELPLIDSSTAIFDPYFRKESISESNLTAGSDGYSHLMKFGEYIMMYLFCWSDVLWDDDFPSVEEVYGNSEEAQEKYNILKKKRYDPKNKHLEDFKNDLAKVRRSLANIATYMIFDDHDVTDDWFLNLKWYEDVVQNNELGKRININGLTAYAVCQAWGNTPERFESGTIGHNLISQIDLSVSGNNNWYNNASSWENIENIVLPVLVNDISYSYLQHPKDPFQNKLDWHFRLEFPTFEIFFLDERTLRGFDDTGFCDRINRNDLDYLFMNPPNLHRELTLIVAPAPLNGLPYLEEFQKIAGSLMPSIIPGSESINEGQKLVRDTEAWGLAELIKERFFSKLTWRSINAQQNYNKNLPFTPHRIVILSGDVHYASVNRMEYWAETTLEPINPFLDTHLIVAQLTSSSSKNQTSDTIDTEDANGDPLKHPGLNLLPFKVSQEIDDVYAGWRPAFSVNSTTLRTIGEYKYEPQVGISTTHYIRYDSPVFLKRENFHFDYELLRILFEDSNSKLKDLKLYDPDIIYRIDFIKSNIYSAFEPEALSSKDLASRKKASKNHRLYASKGGNSKRFFGGNNIGEITFNWPDEFNRKFTYLKLWSRKPFLIDAFPNLFPPVLLEVLKPNHTFPVLMEFDTVQYPKPSINEFK